MREAIFNLDRYLKWDDQFHCWEYCFDTFKMVYGSPSSSIIGIRRYEIISKINLAIMLGTDLSKISNNVMSVYKVV